MGANIYQLQQALEGLESKAAEIAKELHRLYQQYLVTLGQSVSKQLIHAAYHLCTKTEPEAFLSLSLSQQQSLQQGLQVLGYQLQKSLQQTLQETINVDDQRIPPEALVLAHRKVEDEIVTALRRISRDANYILQDHQILQIQSMDTLFEIAAKADEAGRSITTPPHLLKALVEVKESEEEEDNVPIVAIYLQITDLELADPELMSWRHQLRQVSQKLLSLNKDFAQKQQAQITAKAQAAWRASWLPYHPNNKTSTQQAREVQDDDIDDQERNIEDSGV